MSKITFKTVIKNFFYSIAKSYEKKRFWKSLLGSIASALVSAILTAYVLPVYFSVNSVWNQLFSALFFYLTISGVFKVAADIRRGGFFRRFGITCKKVVLGLGSGSFSPGSRIVQAVMMLLAAAGAFFLPPLLGLALGLTLFLSSVAAENSVLLMVAEAFKKKKTALPDASGPVSKRGKNLAAVGVGVLFGCLVAVLVGSFTGFRPSSLLTGTAAQTETEPDGSSDSDRNNGQGGKDQNGKDQDGSTQPENTGSGVTLDDIDRTAETYTADSPFTQKFTQEDMESDAGDADYFFPQDGSGDYLITSFDGGVSYTMWIYDEIGDLWEVRGKKRYESEEALLREYPDAGESSFNEEGYLHDGAVLYYLMPEDEFALTTQGRDKYTMLYLASQGYFDSYYYWFSVPYNPLPAEDAEDTGDIGYPGGDYNTDDGYGDDGYTDGNDGYDDGYNTRYSDLENSVVRLFEGLCTMAGGDYDAFCELFRNMDSSIIDQYYNMEYRDISQFEHETPIIIAQDGNYAYATLLFYTVPADYPRMDLDSYVISTIVSCDDSGEWKIEYTDETLSYLQDEYLQAIHTEGGYDAIQSGRPCARFWLSFDLDYAVTFSGAFVGRVVEMYQYDNGDTVVTLYFSNGTDETVTVGEIQNLCIVDGENVFMQVSADIYSTIEPGSGLLYELNVPADYVTSYGFSRPRVEDFSFTTD